MSNVKTQATRKPATSKKPAKAPSKVSALGFVIAQGFRPTAGARLYAHTLCALDLLGITTEKGAPRKVVTQAMGETAVAYHLRQGNMVHEADGIKLTDQGEMRFNAGRTSDPEAYEGFKHVMTKGTPDGKIVKNATGIKPVQQ